eukprot:m.373684 g.373684  ORF g.373684 m.373684 type:complete len:293 (+) comp20888_c0_seq8:96-974(+)
MMDDARTQIHGTELILIPLDSEEGIDLCQKDVSNFSAEKLLHPPFNGTVLQDNVKASWRCQIGKTCCGLASLAITLSSMAPSRKENAILEEKEKNDDDELHESLGYVTEDDIYPLIINAVSYCNGDKLEFFDVPTQTKVRSKGMTLEELDALANAISRSCPREERHSGIKLPVSISRWHAQCTEVSKGMLGPNASLLSSPEHLRGLLLESLCRPSMRILLNYHMSSLGQSPFGGHISPIAGYNIQTERVLIMDTWPHTEPVWAPLQAVWQAMCHVDLEAGKSRGLLLLEFES